MKKTEKSPRKKYNTGGLLSPVVPVPPEVPEQEESLLQTPVEPIQQDNLLVPTEETVAPAPVQKPEEPVIQESDESFLAAQQRSTRMQSTGHGGLGSAFRPDLEYDEDTVITPKVEYGDDGLPVNLDYETRRMIENARREEELAELNYDPRLAAWEQNQAELAYDGKLTPEQYVQNTYAIKEVTVPLIRKRKEFLVNENGNRYHPSVFEFQENLKNNNPELYKEAFPELLINGEIWISNFTPDDYANGERFADFMIRERDAAGGALSREDALVYMTEVSQLAVLSLEKQLDVTGLTLNEFLHRYDYNGSGELTSGDITGMVSDATKPKITTSIEYLNNYETHAQAIKRLNTSPEEAAQQVNDIILARPLQLNLTANEKLNRYDLNGDNQIDELDAELASIVATNQSIYNYLNIFEVTRDSLEEQNNPFVGFSENELAHQVELSKNIHSQLQFSVDQERKNLWNLKAIALHKVLDFSDGDYTKSPFFGNLVFSVDSPRPERQFYASFSDYNRATINYAKVVTDPIFYKNPNDPLEAREYKDEYSTSEARRAWILEDKANNSLTSENFYPYSGAYSTPNFNQRQEFISNSSVVRDFKDIPLEVKEPDLNPYVDLSEEDKIKEAQKIRAALDYIETLGYDNSKQEYRKSDDATVSAVALHLSMDFSDGDYTKSPFYDFIPLKGGFTMSMPKPVQELYSSLALYSKAYNSWQNSVPEMFELGLEDHQTNIQHAISYNGTLLDWYGKEQAALDAAEAERKKIEDTLQISVEGLSEEEISGFNTYLRRQEEKLANENDERLQRRIRDPYVSYISGQPFDGSFRPVHPNLAEARKRLEFLSDDAEDINSLTSEQLNKINEYKDYLEINEPEIFSNLKFNANQFKRDYTTQSGNTGFLVYDTTTHDYVSDTNHATFFIEDYINNLKILGFEEPTVEDVNKIFDELLEIEISSEHFHNPDGTVKDNYKDNDFFLKRAKIREDDIILALENYIPGWAEENLPDIFYKYRPSVKESGISYLDWVDSNSIEPKKEEYEESITGLVYHSHSHRKKEIYDYDIELWKEWYPDRNAAYYEFRPISEYLENNPSVDSLDEYYVRKRREYLLENFPDDSEMYNEFLKDSYKVNISGFLKAIEDDGHRTKSGSKFNTADTKNYFERFERHNAGQAGRRLEFLKAFPEQSYPETAESFLLEYAKLYPKKVFEIFSEDSDVKFLPLEEISLPVTDNQIEERVVYLVNSGEPIEPLAEKIKEKYPSGHIVLQQKGLVPVNPVYDDTDKNYSPLDIDRDGIVSALTDGLLLFRGMFGLTGEALTKDTIGDKSPKSPEEIDERVGYLLKLSEKDNPELFKILDIDNNQKLDALTDGLAIMRYMFKLTGEDFIKETIAEDSPYAQDDIEAQYKRAEALLGPLVDDYRKAVTTPNMPSDIKSDRYDLERDERVTPGLSISNPIKTSATLGDARKYKEALEQFDDTASLNEFKNTLLLNGQHTIYTTLFPDDEPPTPKHLDNSIREGYGGETHLHSPSLAEAKLRRQFLIINSTQSGLDNYNENLLENHPETYEALYAIPEFTADSPEPNLNHYPEDRQDAVFEAWQVATFDMPAFDAFSDEPILTDYPEAVRQAVYDAYTIAKASFVVPTFNQLSPEPVISDYPEGKFDEVYEAWLEATADPVFDANSPEPSVADYPAERFDKIYNDWLEATFVMPTFNASSPEPNLNNYPESQRDAVFQAWLDSRPEEEPETEEPTEAPDPIVPEAPITLEDYVTAQYSKNSLPPVESNFTNPNFPAGAYEEELKAWAAAKDIQLGDPFPIRGDLTAPQYMALLTEWTNKGNKLDIGPKFPEEPKPTDTIVTPTSEPDYSYFEDKLVDPDQYPYTSRSLIEERNARYQVHIDDLKLYYAERDAIFAGTATEPPTNPGLMQHPGPYPLFSSPEEALSLAEQQENWRDEKDAYDAYVIKKAIYDLSSAEYERQVIENMEGGGEQSDPETEEPIDEIEIPEIDDTPFVPPKSTPEEDYSFLVEPIEPEGPESSRPGHRLAYAEAVTEYNIKMQEYRDNVAKMKDIYEHYYPIINGQNMSFPPRVPERVYPPVLPDNPSYDQMVNYQKEQTQYVIYQKAQALYLQAQPIYDSFIGGNMSTGNNTRTRTSSVTVTGESETGAPTGLTQTVPVAPDVTVDDPIDMPTDGDTITADDSIEALDDAADVGAVTVAAPTMPTVKGQALPDEVVGPDEDVTSTGYTAATSDANVTATAADAGTVSREAFGTTIGASTATAATATAEDIETAKGTAATGELSENSLAIAATAMSAAKNTDEYITLSQNVNDLYAIRENDGGYKDLVNKRNSATTPENKAYFQSQINALPVHYKYVEAEAKRLEFLESKGAQKIAEVEGPGTADTYNATTLSSEDLTELVNIAEERGVDINDLPEYDMAKQRVAQEAVAAAGEAAKIEEAAQIAQASQAEVAKANDVADALSVDIEETPAYTKAASRTAQTAEAAEGTATEISSADTAVDLQTREAITGTAPQGTAAEIGGVPTYEAAQMQAVTSEDRTLNATEMIEVVAELPEEMSAAIAQDPAEVMAQLDEDPVTEVVVKVAALPEEALVSVQMETLLAGMDDGEIPTWARPTIAALDGIMARRGLSASTVGRDAMFNAIIQSALPIAQSNATALKDMALANLSNEQQAAVTNANNSMQLRIQNLANRQLAVSETARMAQEIAVKQSTFDQQAAVISSEQQQQTALINTQNAQAKASADAQMAQQAAIAEFSENSRRDYENLKALNDANVNNLNAEQAARLKNYDAQITTMVRQAELNQDIEKANLSASLSVELQNLSQQNDAAKDTMTAENQERLVNLQTLVDLRKTNATFAQQMDMANLTNEQQIELAMLQEKAATDSANFTADNQFRLNELNNKVARSIRQAELDARIAEINFDASLKLELTELTEKNATNRANMTAENQVRLANLNALIDFKKTNASFAQQMEIANLSNEQQITVANLTEKAAADAANFTEANRFELQRLTIASQLLSSNEQLRLNADLARLNTEERVALANLTYTNQFDSAKMTAENTAELQRYEKQMEAGRVNAQLAQQMGLQELSNAQQTAMFNAQINSNLDFKQFDADQQVQIANSAFMQTMTIREFDAQQQVAIQNATMLANRNIAQADMATKIAITNAQNFLKMDMANLSNDQQVAVLNAQMAQQAMLSDLAAENAAAQFSAANQQQADQYMASLGVQIEQYNVSAMAARNQFNAAEANRQEAIKAGNTLQAATISAQMQADIAKFNEQQDLARDQWNAANAQAVEQSNIQWRRQANTANTAAQNAANQQNAQIAFNLTSQEQTQLWQLLRDEAAYARQAYENDEQRKAQLYATAISNEQLVKTTERFEEILDTDF